MEKNNKLLNRPCAHQNTTEIILNDEPVNGYKLAEAFNNFFVNLVNSSRHPDATRMVPRNANSLYLSPTSEAEVQATFASLSNTTSCDIDGIQIIPIKQ